MSKIYYLTSSFKIQEDFPEKNVVPRAVIVNDLNQSSKVKFIYDLMISNSSLKCCKVFHHALNNLAYLNMLPSRIYQSEGWAVHSREIYVIFKKYKGVLLKYLEKNNMLDEHIKFKDLILCLVTPNSVHEPHQFNELWRFFMLFFELYLQYLYKKYELWNHVKNLPEVMHEVSNGVNIYNVGAFSCFEKGFTLGIRKKEFADYAGYISDRKIYSDDEIFKYHVLERFKSFYLEKKFEPLDKYVVSTNNVPNAYWIYYVVLTELTLRDYFRTKKICKHTTALGLCLLDWYKEKYHRETNLEGFLRQGLSDKYKNSLFDLVTPIIALYFFEKYKMPAIYATSDRIIKYFDTELQINYDTAQCKYIFKNKKCSDTSFLKSNKAIIDNKLFFKIDIRSVRRHFRNVPHESKIRGRAFLINNLTFLLPNENLGQLSENLDFINWEHNKREHAKAIQKLLGLLYIPLDIIIKSQFLELYRQTILRVAFYMMDPSMISENDVLEYLYRLQEYYLYEHAKELAKLL